MVSPDVAAALQQARSSLREVQQYGQFSFGPSNLQSVDAQAQRALAAVCKLTADLYTVVEGLARQVDEEGRSNPS